MRCVSRTDTGVSHTRVDTRNLEQMLQRTYRTLADGLERSMRAVCHNFVSYLRASLTQSSSSPIVKLWLGRPLLAEKGVSSLRIPASYW